MLSKDLKKAFKIYKKNNSKFVFPIVEYSHPLQRALKFHNKFGIKSINFVNANNRTQDLEKAYFDSGQFYFGSKYIWQSNKNIHNNAIPLIIPSWRVVDIDDINDWKRAELLFKTFKYFK
jgi:CMP-N-acetylneuraminic acid synthetase